MKPADSTPPQRPDDPEQEAALWVVRRDRGLTAAEQDELSLWLAADPRHGTALAEHRWGWDELDRLTGLQTTLGAVPDPDLFAPRARPRAMGLFRLGWVAPLTLTAAAIVFLAVRPPSVPVRTEMAASVAPAGVLAAPCERRVLDDGSVVDLNRGAAIEVTYSARERRVRLVRGEANFTVARDPARPFIVSAGSVEMRAVGTVFNVRLDAAEVEVVVAEGRVKVESTHAISAAAEPPLLAAGQSALVSRRAPVPPQVVTLSPQQFAARLAWQPRMLDFTGALLSEIVAEFNRRNPVQLVIDDPALLALRLSATFRSDNVQGFARLMESDFGMAAEQRGDLEIRLRRAPVR